MIPNETLVELGKGTIDWENDSFEVALLKETTEYSPDPDNHNFVSDVIDGGTTGAEYDDTNYTPGFGNSGRVGLTNTTATPDDTNDRAQFDADDVTYNSLGSATGGQTVEAAIVYKVGTSDADSRIIKVFDDSEEADLPKQTNNEDFTLQFDTTGVFRLDN